MEYSGADMGFSLWDFLAIAVASGCAVGLVAIVMESPVGKVMAEALARRWKTEEEISSPALGEELDTLTAEVINLRHDLDELKAELPRLSPPD